MRSRAKLGRRERGVAVGNPSRRRGRPLSEARPVRIAKSGTRRFRQGTPRRRAGATPENAAIVVDHLTRSRRHGPQIPRRHPHSTVSRRYRRRRYRARRRPDRGMADAGSRRLRWRTRASARWSAWRWRRRRFTWRRTSRCRVRHRPPHGPHRPDRRLSGGDRRAKAASASPSAAARGPAIGGAVRRSRRPPRDQPDRLCLSGRGRARRSSPISPPAWCRKASSAA